MHLINVVLRCKQFYSCVQAPPTRGHEKLKARDARLSWVCFFFFSPLSKCKVANILVGMEIFKIGRTNVSVTWKFACMASASFWNF